MNKLYFILILVLLSSPLFSQLQSIKSDQFAFNIKKNYKIDKSVKPMLFFYDTIIIDNYQFAKWISVTKSDINPKDFNILDISDCSELREVSTDEVDPSIDKTIQGVTEIGEKKVYFEYKLTENYFDWSKEKFKDIQLRVQYYLLENGIIYRLNYRFMLLNTKKQILDTEFVLKIFRHNSNIGDLNMVLESLKIKK